MLKNVKFKLFFLPILLVTSQPAKSIDFKSTFKGMFGITSTTDYLNRFKILREMEITLAEINKLNLEVRGKEKDISDIQSRAVTDFKKLVEETEQKLNDLSADILKESEQRVSDLKERIARREGSITDLQKAITQEGKLAQIASNLDWISMGMTKMGTEYIRKMDNASKKSLEDQISSRRKSIFQIQQELTQESQAVKNIFTSPSYQEKATALKKKLTEAEVALANISANLETLRKDTLFTPHDPQAKALIEKLKKHISDAKCRNIRDMSEAKAAAISACKKENLDGAKKAIQAVSSCKSLTMDSPTQEIDSCITTYRRDVLKK